MRSGFPGPLGGRCLYLHRTLGCQNWELSGPHPPFRVETQAWGRTGPYTGGHWWGWDRNPASGLLCTEAPNHRVWVTVYFGAWAVLIFPPTHSISKGQRAAGMEEVLALGYF